MESTLDRILADFQAWSPPPLTPRMVSLPSLPGKVDVIVGMRRTGKTFLLHQKLREIEASGVPRSRCFEFNLEDERLAPLETRDLQKIPEALFRRHPGSRTAECWFLFDEIHNVPGWEQFIRRLVDAGSARIVVTGSSSRLLSSEIATSMRGRSLATELLPFSFQEALAHAGIERPDRWPPPAGVRSLLENRFLSYLETGGFPEVQSVGPEHRRRILQDYVDVVVFRDVVERHAISNIPALRWLVRRLLRSPGMRLSLHRLHQEMRSNALRVGKDLLHAMTGHLQDAYFAFATEIHGNSEKKRLVNPRKFYLADPALADVARPIGIDDTGHRLENLVYLELRRRGIHPRYHVTASGREIDFVASTLAGRPEIIQVCADPAAPEARERELRAVEEAFSEVRTSEATIVTLHQEGHQTVGGGEIRFVPAWRWFLEPAVAEGTGRPSDSGRTPVRRRRPARR